MFYNDIHSKGTFRIRRFGGLVFFFFFFLGGGGGRGEWGWLMLIWEGNKLGYKRYTVNQLVRLWDQRYLVVVVDYLLIVY